MKNLMFLLTFSLTLLACGADAAVPTEPIPDVPEQCAPAGAWDLALTFEPGTCNLFEADATINIVETEGGYSVSVDDSADGVSAEIDEECAVHVIEVFEAESHIDGAQVSWNWDYSFWREPGTANVQGGGSLALYYREGDLVCDQEFLIAGTVRPSTP